MKKLLLATAIITMMVIGCTKEQNPPAPIITTIPNPQPTDTVITPVDTIPSDTVITPVDTIPTDTIPVDTITRKVVRLVLEHTHFNVADIDFNYSSSGDLSYLYTYMQPYVFEYILDEGEFIYLESQMVHLYNFEPKFMVITVYIDGVEDFSRQVYVQGQSISCTIVNNFNLP